MADFALSGKPGLLVAVPAAVGAAANGWALAPVWVNEVGGITFEMARSGERRFIKWAPAGSGLDLAGEAERCRWAAPYLAVPEVIELGEDATGTWMITAALPGENAVTERWKADPATAARAIGTGLRKLHDSLPVDDCPYTWSIEERLARAHAMRSEAELHGYPDFRDFPIESALAELEDIPTIDKLVVCHGDACSPNTLIDEDGRCSGHVDMGSLGVADRWADLAVATWATTWNYGHGWEEPLLDAYGIEPDPARTRYYRLLWALS